MRGSGASRSWGTTISGLGEFGDAGLVQLAQAGDGEAFAELFRRHYPAVVATCGRRGLADAEEVAQAAFVRAFERIDRCQGEARFGAWVQVIARHVRARTRETTPGRRSRGRDSYDEGEGVTWPSCR